jgi:hypothetical protein
MPNTTQPFKSVTPSDLEKRVETLNLRLQSRSDKDWNYSRITLCLRTLASLDSAYVLWPESIDASTKAGKAAILEIESEVTWGERHSNELGILETVSLRLNRALLDARGGDDPREFVALRLIKRRDLIEEGIPVAVWYAITEVSGEDFDSR